ncbi:ABC transporter ATP-binding protein [Rouxiella sp. T17]|uniref:ABC transporter ATP-binding protein n=1 Tax=Rouxiella sp. T17 TaxID=3085684 RepID=UPI002FC85D98
MAVSNTQSHPQTVLEIAQLCLRIEEKILIDNLNLTLHAGEKVCLLGASGSGKSLTAKAVIGTSPANAVITGSIRVMGEDVANLHPLQRSSLARVSAIFQDSSSALNPLMTVGKQLLLLQNHKNKEALNALLAQVELGSLEELMRRYPAQLSGGQRQRACIALALMGNSKLLVADEPTTALDVIAQRRVLEVLHQVCAAKNAPALLFITHDIAVAAQLCDRAIVMESGRVVESATLRQLITQPKHPYTRQLIVAAQTPKSGTEAIAV